MLAQLQTFLHTCGLPVQARCTRVRARSPTWRVAEALDLIIESSFEELDSGGEEDINEDPAFPLPSQESVVSEDSDFEGNILTTKNLKQTYKP